MTGWQEDLISTWPGRWRDEAHNEFLKSFEKTHQQVFNCAEERLSSFATVD